MTTSVALPTIDSRAVVPVIAHHEKLARRHGLGAVVAMVQYEVTGDKLVLLNQMHVCAEGFRLVIDFVQIQRCMTHQLWIGRAILKGLSIDDQMIVHDLNRVAADCDAAFDQPRAVIGGEENHYIAPLRICPGMADSPKGERHFEIIRQLVHEDAVAVEDGRNHRAGRHVVPIGDGRTHRKQDDNHDHQRTNTAPKSDQDMRGLSRWFAGLGRVLLRWCRGYGGNTLRH